MFFVRHPKLNLVWSHHQKIVVVDNRVAFVGGLDLCIGRFDNHQHPLTDSKKELFGGKEYYNPDIKPPGGLNKPFKDSINRRRFPRLPWHDVHAKIEGMSVGDIHFSFVQKWNFAIGKKKFSSLLPTKKR